MDAVVGERNRRVGSYFLLHQWAGEAVTVSAPPGDIGGLVGQMLWRTLATVGQYLVPPIFLTGAGLSIMRRRERQQLVADVVRSRAPTMLDGMSWQQFEKVVGEAFRLQGYRVVETARGGADGGIDLVLAKGTEAFLVQCKHWRAFKVGVSVVRELYGVMAARGAAGGMVVTSGRFTGDAIAFAEGRNIELLDGPKLHALIGARCIPTEATPGGAARTTASSGSVVAEEPTCPHCAKRMVRRTAKRGTKAGEPFWGCSGYPICRGTRDIRSMQGPW